MGLQQTRWNTKKKLDTNCIKKLGWEAKTNLDNGIKSTLSSYKKERLNQYDA